ncbi:hypothetical protein GCM10010230_18440 [Streptomyces narbonensis]|nr:hypothetical protein GCM10010230_18440 [Streptomyces narbonensis]
MHGRYVAGDELAQHEPVVTPEAPTRGRTHATTLRSPEHADWGPGKERFTTLHECFPMMS